TGGTEKNKYFVSGEYMNQEGVASGSNFERYSFRATQDSKPLSWLNFGTSITYNQTFENLKTSSENLITSAINLTPQIPVKNLDGTWGGGDNTNQANLYAPVNPLAIASLITNTNMRRNLLGNAYLQINLFKGLVFKTQFSGNLYVQNTDYYIPLYSIGWAINTTNS